MFKKRSLLILLLIVLILPGCTDGKDSPRETREIYDVEGKSENWDISLEYSITEREKVSVEGEVTYIGDKVPVKVDMLFVMYDVEPTSFYNKDIGNINTIVEFEGGELIDKKINISQSFAKEHDPEVYKEAIAHGYIEMKWEENDISKIEKISLNIID